MIQPPNQRIVPLSVSRAGRGEDSDGDMPPLEYVGYAASDNFRFREGDRVVLTGLSKADLNGQSGTLLDFTKKPSERLPVRLDSGKQLAVRPQNLVASSAVVGAVACEDDDDLPPLEPAVGSNAAPPQEAGESDDDMPPLEYVGGAGAAATPAACDDDDDDMPPLEYVGAGQAAPQPAQASDSDDDMPPLDYVGAAAASASAAPQPVDDDDDDMPPLEYVGGAAPSASAPAPARSPKEDSEDEMPPLEYVGSAASASSSAGRSGVAQASKRAAGGGAGDEDYADMPPLEYVGLGAADAYRFREGDRVVLLKAPAAAVRAGETGVVGKFTDSTRDRLPVRLDASGREVSVLPEHLQHAQGGGDGSMTAGPSRAAGASQRREAAAKQAHAAAGEASDDMPPLEYVGVNVSDNYCFREGDRVVLRGLSKSEMNGLRGVIGKFPAVVGERLPVRIDGSGKVLAIKPENLEAVDAARATAVAPPVVVADDDEDLPPLEPEAPAVAAPAVVAPAVVAPSVVAPARGSASAAHPATSSTTPAAPADPRPGAGPPRPPFDAGDRVVLAGLSKADLNGRRGVVLLHTSRGSNVMEERLPVKLDGTGQTIAVKAWNLLAEPDDDDDDDMPPLEHVGVVKADGVQKAAADDDDDDMPPLEYVGAVKADGVQKAAVHDEDDDDDMPPLEYVGAAKGDGVQKAVADDDDDDMPPLEYVGVVKRDGVQQAAADDDDDDMPPLEYVGVVKREGVQQAPPDDDDDMPPLEYVGAAKDDGLQKAVADDDDDDDMPPLEYVGVVTGDGFQKAAADDDDMPPLEYVGTARGYPAQKVEEEDDDMPPLEHVGVTAAGAKVGEGSDSGDSMPPLDDLTKPSASPPQQRSVAADDADMPPLEYIGAAAQFRFREGDAVVLRGLTKADLNGQRATVLRFEQVSNGRLPMRLESTGQKLAIKPENLEAAGQPPEPVAEAVGADEYADMPPLDYSISRGARAVEEVGSAEDFADMPPLEYVGASGAAPVAGDTVLLAGLQNASLNGERARILEAAPKHSRKDRVPVLLLRTGQKLSVKPENMQRVDAHTAAAPSARGLAAADVVAAAPAPPPAPGGRGPAPAAPRPGSGPAPAAAPPASGGSAASRSQALLERMRRALQSDASPAEVGEALAHIDASKGVDWGPDLQAKKMLLKRLRAKKKKLDGQEEPPRQPSPAEEARSSQSEEAKHGDKPESEWVLLHGDADASVEAHEMSNGASPPPGDFGAPGRPQEEPAQQQGKKRRQKKAGAGPAQEAAAAAAPAAKAAAAPSPAKASPAPPPAKDAPAAPAQAKPPPPAAPSTTTAPASGDATGGTLSSVTRWCQEHQLPMELVDKLAEEEVLEPEELTTIPDDELVQLTVGWKMGPKARFLKAVQRMRATERSELGSAYCGSEAGGGDWRQKPIGRE